MTQARFELHGEERFPDLPPLDIIESVRWDYSTMGLSPRIHPLAPFRAELDRRGLPDAQTLNARPDGTRVRYAGLAICRQRPGTASGVVFMTLEDESGFVNLVIWSRTFEKHAVLIKTSSLLGVSGILQVEEGVAHVIAEDFWVPGLHAPPERIESRDFH